MSMDDQYRQLELFKEALTHFHEHMQSSMRDLDERYRMLEPFWQDQMRVEHDDMWRKAIEIITIFLDFTGFKYIAFFAKKIMELAAYLWGTNYRP